MSFKLDYKTAPTDRIAADMGVNLARTRLARNITQAQLADRAGISMRTLGRFEAGHGATLDTLVRLMRALGLEDNLAMLLPDPGIQPVALVRTRGRKRHRARPVPAVDAPSWTWGEEREP